VLVVASKVGSVGSVPKTGNPALRPAFNASFSALFKSFFDVLPEETLSEMPVLIAATGGTERQSLVLEHALRPMFSYLHAIVAPTGVSPPARTSAPNTIRSALPSESARLRSISRGCCKPVARVRRDVFTEELTEMEQLLVGATGPGNEDANVED
jgi:FMN reductase